MDNHEDNCYLRKRDIKISLSVIEAMDLRDKIISGKTTIKDVPKEIDSFIYSMHLITQIKEAKALLEKEGYIIVEK